MTRIITRRMPAWTLLLAGSFLAGCVRFQPQPLSPAQTAAQIESRRLDDAGLKKFLDQTAAQETTGWPLQKWDLNSLALAAFYFQPDLEVARAQWRVTQAGIKTAGGRPNPTVSVVPGYNTSAGGGVNPFFPAVTFDLPLETAGKRAKRISAAEKLSLAARGDLITAAWKVRADVRTALLDLKFATQRAALIEKQFSTQQQMVKLLQQRFEVGSISRPELTAARINFQKSELDLSDARSKASLARVQLAQAIGISADALEKVNLDFNFTQPSPEILTDATARQMALQGRADIQSALASYAASEDDLRGEIAKQFPDVHVNPGYQFDQGENKWSLGLTVELPILNQNHGPIAEAEARRKLAAAKFIALQTHVIGEIDRAVAEWRAVFDQVATGETLFAAQQSQLKSMQAQMENGAADALDVAGAQLELNLGALAVLDGKILGQRALGALEDALQRPADSIAEAIRKLSTENSNGKDAPQ